VPDSPGVPAEIAGKTHNAVFNDLSSVRKILEKDPGGVACVIVEGVPGNMGVVRPKAGFMEGLRVLTRRYGVVFIMDEVMSGFRLCYGGAQKVYKIEPDMTCLGKVIGGGLPVGAFGGKTEIMEKLAPLGPVYQAGTLSGNPLAMVAGIETLKQLKKKGTYEKLTGTTDMLCDGVEEIAKRRSVQSRVARAGSMFTVFFTNRQVKNYQDAKKCDLEKFARYFLRMLKGGVYLPPSQFEAAFVSLAHTRADITKTLETVDRSFKGL
jgi:glutamate-1-semialdehyde 2,1-aminomutase